VNTFKQVCRTLVQLAKQVWSLPQAIANAVQRRKLQIVRNEREAERLDRIRNPSKYLGK
jgi:chorismate mutase